MITIRTLFVLLSSPLTTSSCVRVLFSFLRLIQRKRTCCGALMSTTFKLQCQWKWRAAVSTQQTVRSRSDGEQVSKCVTMKTQMNFTSRLCLLHQPQKTKLWLWQILPPLLVDILHLPTLHSSSLQMIFCCYKITLFKCLHKYLWWGMREAGGGFLLPPFCLL